MTANSVVNQIFQSESFVLQKGLNCPKLHDSRRWYTRRPFPVQTPRFKALVHQKAFSCTNSTIQGVGTPDGLFLYQIHDSMQLVHQKAFSCTNSTIQGDWYTRRPFPVQTPRFKAIGTPDGLSLYKPTIQCSWYTRRPFPVQTHDSRRLVHQTAFSCTKSTIQGGWYTRRPFPVPNPRFNAVGTPDGLFLYQLQSSN